MNVYKPELLVSQLYILIYLYICKFIKYRVSKKKIITIYLSICLPYCLSMAIYLVQYIPGVTQAKKNSKLLSLKCYFSKLQSSFEIPRATLGTSASLSYYVKLFVNKLYPIYVYLSVYLLIYLKISQILHSKLSFQ